MDIQFEGTASLGRSLYTNIVLNERLIGFIGPNGAGEMWVAMYNRDGSLDHTIVRQFGAMQSKDVAKKWLRELFSQCQIDDVSKVSSLSPLDLYMKVERASVTTSV